VTYRFGQFVREILINPVRNIVRTAGFENFCIEHLSANFVRENFWYRPRCREIAGSRRGFSGERSLLTLKEIGVK
jgi:hypothetical protein